MANRVVPFPSASRRNQGRSLRAPLATLLRRLITGVGDLDRTSRERRYLDEMDDRTLRDLGVTRAEVEAELRRRVSWAALLFRG